MPKLVLTYPTVLELLRHHLVASRTESRAFVAWFLEHFYRLELSEAQDAVCDGPDDKGVDAIFIDDNLERIEILQGKLFQNAAKTLGDVALKEFAGTLDQFRTRAGVEAVQSQTANVELANLLRESKVADLVDQGYEVRGVFVTNASRDANASTYVATRSDMAVFDAIELEAAFVPTGHVAPAGGPVIFDITGYDVVEYQTPEARAFVAPLLASELVTLDGLSNGALFSWNVRQSLGRTKVNRAIAESVKEQSEHKNFLLYHNGLTILCEKADFTPDRIQISGYSVVNGCQSLTTLYEQRKSISSELRLLARIIELRPDTDLAAKITRHSNHQNAIGARDLQSNSSIQRRLQSEFSKLYPGEVSYEIKRGETSTATLVIGNDEAARILLAFDREQPWVCHQTYRHFDELHGDIFARPEVDARRIRALYLALERVRTQLPTLKNKFLASYRLVQYFILYLLRRALETDDQGRAFVKRPQDFVSQENGILRLGNCLDSVLSDIIVDLNAELEEREEEGTPFDYKRELKSPTAVKALATAVVPMYEKAVKRGRVESFAAEWAASAETP